MRPVIDENGRYHTGLFKKAENVPVGYFSLKLLKGFELIFTGHGLGGALAAMIALKMLYLTFESDEDYCNKILFIGFGCPSIADIYFKQESSSNFKQNFIFIQNKNDLVAETLDYISNLIYAQKQDQKSLAFFSSFAGNILQNMDSENLESICQQMSATTETKLISDLKEPNYAQFGSLFELSIKGLNEVNSFRFNKTNFNRIVRNSKELHQSVKNHLIQNYLRTLKEAGFLPGKANQTAIVVDSDLDIKILNMQKFKNSLRLSKNKYNTDISFSLEFMSNASYLVAAKLIIGRKIIFGKIIKARV